MYKKIFIDQCGYTASMKKAVTFRSDKPVSFAVLSSDGNVVLTGKASHAISNTSAGETNYIGDFSALTIPGKYYISAGHLGESDTFVISPDAYASAWQKLIFFYYQQRCGFDLNENVSGMYAHRACHTSIARVYDSDVHKSVTGGWHDAGDYGRYVGPGAMTVAQLLYAYERNEPMGRRYRNPSIDSPLPAFLEEVKYELDWMMTMQREDGALYHKATCANFCKFIMPEEEQEEILLSPVSVTATGDFAAVCAMAVDFYKPYDLAYAHKLEEASKKAYCALKNMSLPGGFHNPTGITTGEYGDPCDIDERYWAAAQLYKAFGDECYRSDFEAIANDKIYHGYGWAGMGTYGNLAYLSAGRPVNETLCAQIRKEMVHSADVYLTLSIKDGYGTALDAKEYVWGSNMDVANRGIMLYDAYTITGDEKYLAAAGEQMHYLLGRNPMGLCYVSGCGTDSIKHPHHRPSGYLGKAMEGMLSGGPCSWLADEVAKEIFTKDTPPAKCLADMTGSYSTNEVTIYWNSALILLMASVLAKV